MKAHLSASSTAKAWRREAQRQFRLIRKVERATAAGKAEALHDLRVGIRRLRVLLRALENPLARTPGTALSRRWQQFTRRLSPARDADVWRALLKTLPAVTPAFRQRVLKRLDRERGRRAALFAGDTWAHLQRATGALLKTAGATPSPLDRELNKIWDRATTRAGQLARSRQLAQPDVAHEVRIACRRARYLAEFFAVAAKRRQTRHAWLKIAQRYQAAQNALGQTHDADTLLEFLKAQRLRPPAQLRAALIRRRTQGLARFRQAWKNLDT